MIIITNTMTPITMPAIAPPLSPPEAKIFLNRYMLRAEKCSQCKHNILSTAAFQKEATMIHIQST